MLVPKPLRRSLGTDQGQLPFAPSLGLPGGRCSVICGWFPLGGTWKRPCCEPRSASSSAMLGPLWWTPQCELRLPLVLLFGHLLEATFQSNTGCSLCQVWGRQMEVTMQAESGGFCQAWGFLARGTSQLLFDCSLWTFQRFWEIPQQELRQVACVEKLLKRVRLDAKLVGVGSQGVTRAG